MIDVSMALFFLNTGLMAGKVRRYHEGATPGLQEATMTASKSTGDAAKGRGKSNIRKKPPIKIGSQEWKEAVAAAAYYRAEARGFYGGSPEQDWLDAEAELRERLALDAGRPATAQLKPRSKKSGKVAR
jgi:hypothetical protein